MHQVKTFITLIKRSAYAFDHDNGFKLSASLSYYTVFALGPLLLIMISLSSIVYRKDAIQGRIFEQLRGLIGDDAALQIQDILSNVYSTRDTTSGAIIGG